ncbi:MAG: GTP cyclohydrolase I FolE [Elusimicrobia bacterium]|jgi:GTP cyclohydrolase I|nr:GTP cyclohydrolase I FolE [Elusimicrobiota bacterium]
MKKNQIKKAVKVFLDAIGENPDREGLKDTPDRVARMCEEIFSSYESQPVSPPVYFRAEKYSEIILVKDIDFHSVCEHHLLPFYGKAHVAYIPSEGNVTGLSKIARLVDSVSNRLQLQETLTEVVADSMMENLNPLGAMVVIEAQHLCMIMRGIKKPGSKVITSAMRGVFLKDARTRAEALSLIKQD